jgi:hypothetical protein
LFTKDESLALASRVEVSECPVLVNFSPRLLVISSNVLKCPMYLLIKDLELASDFFLIKVYSDSSLSVMIFHAEVI